MTREEQDEESAWWGDCGNTFGEEYKQLVYAEFMGLRAENINGKWPVFDLRGKSVLDIGGGPSSMLLKSVNGAHRTVVDPCDYPQWIADRYASAGIEYRKGSGEVFASGRQYDEVWIYNVLQHVESPERVIENALWHADAIRIFEWVDIPPHPGHPHQLSKVLLDQWIGTVGAVLDIDRHFAVGTCYFAQKGC